MRQMIPAVHLKKILLAFFPDWFRGYAIKNKAQKGIFPRSYVQVKEATVHISG